MGSVCCTLRDIQGHFQQPSDASVEAGHLTKGLYQYRALLLQLFIFLTLAVLSFLVSTMSRGEFGRNTRLTAWVRVANIYFSANMSSALHSRTQPMNLVSNGWWATKKSLIMSIFLNMKVKDLANTSEDVRWSGGSMDFLPYQAVSITIDSRGQFVTWVIATHHHHECQAPGLSVR